LGAQTPTGRDRLPANEVVEEFNRYNWRRLEIADPSIANLQVGGWFESTNVDGFVADLNKVFGIRAVTTEDAASHEQIIQLRRRPSGPP
jgi:ferric-dicitrate binding protein FerR (iron transport regulator)